MKKFLAFFLAVLILLSAAGFVGYKYLVPKTYPVFLESFGNGVLTVDSDESSGEDGKYLVRCKNGEKITVNINPERTKSTYYNLKKLTVNGVDVTDEVYMLQYKTTVKGKLDILAYFEKGKNPNARTGQVSVEYNKEPDISLYADNAYFGSYDAYDFSSPSIIFDEKSGYYYAFGSGNKVAKSKDLVNWVNKTTYFEIPSGAQNDSVMRFSQFESVKTWAKTHGYDEDEAFSSPSNNREPKSPDIIKVGSAYYLYYTLTKAENANESAIFCVRTTDLEYAVKNKDWQDVGIVISSCGYNKGANKKDTDKSHYDESCAAAPAVFEDKEGGLFMTYGSYFGKENINGGIYLLELSPKTGLLKENSKYNGEGKKISTLHGKKTYKTGTLIAKPGNVPGLEKESGSLISESDIIYNSKTGYYYLFVTYGTAQSNYEIRVARSKNIDGPYTDYDGASMATFDSSSRKNQYTKGITVMKGYNFIMSSGGGVSYVDVGKATPGCPSIIETKSGKWIMATQSRAYYKAEDIVVTGDALAEELELDVDTAPYLETRQLFFTGDNWPVAVAEAYSGEDAKTTLKASDMNGHFDVVIFSKENNEDDYKAVSRQTSHIVTVTNGKTISVRDIDKGRNISDLKFSKNGNDAYDLYIDSVKYTVYPTIAWDWELSSGVIVFSGIGENGKTIWGKKNMSAYMGIYTDAFYYALAQADEDTQALYKKKMEKISDNPSQSAIDSMTSKIIKIILEAEK